MNWKYLDIESRISRGQSKEAARSDYMNVQWEILDQMTLTIRELDPEKQVIFDYCTPDNLAFLELHGLEWPDAFVKAACAYQFKRAFFLDEPRADRRIDKDKVRTETRDERHRIGDLLLEIYSQLEIPIARVRGNTLQRLNLLVNGIASSM